LLLASELYTRYTSRADKAYLYAVDFREWTYKSSLVPFAKAEEREGGGRECQEHFA